MATGQLSGVIRHLRRVALVPDGANRTDEQLLECFLTRREEAAFAELVRRHGPMVLGVCRRILRHAQDAEDAFQATFLVLVRKATSIVPRERVGNWLYGVAYRTALEARKTIRRRRTKEREVKDRTRPAALQGDGWHELQPLLDQELSRLPDRYRVPVVLCDLEGKTHKEVARQLGCPQGTLSSRLVRARALLAKRLRRHGLDLPAGELEASLAWNVAPVTMPAPLVVSTVKAASFFAARQAAVAGVISARVAALTEGVRKAMFLTKLKIVTALLLVVGVLVAGAGATAYHALGAGQTDTKKEGAPKPEASKPQALEERALEGHTDGIGMVAISRDGRRALSCGLTYGDGDPTVRLWDLKTGKELKRLEGHADGVYGVAFSPDGKKAVSSGDDKTIRLWDLETGKELKRLEGEDCVYGVVFSPDGKFLLSASCDKTVRLWDVETGKELKRFEGHTDRVRKVVFSPDGKRALSGGYDRTMRYWDIETGKELRSFEVDTAGDVIATMAFSPDGKRAVSSAGDKTLRLWDLESGQEIRRFKGHAKIVHNVAFSPDGKRLLSGGHDQTVRLWDVDSGKELARFFGHVDFVTDVAFSPDGRNALSGSMDKTLRLWRLPK
jgi:RNA polymerase sigma factor (sigma-70 family)